MPFARPSEQELRERAEARKQANLRGLLAGAATRAARGRYGQAETKAAPPAREKVPQKACSRIRDSARGEECTVRIPGVCARDPEKTIWSHARWHAAGRGKGTKALDLAGAYCCTACDAVYDGQAPAPAGYTREQVDADWCMGHFRSLLRLAQKGLL